MEHSVAVFLQLHNDAQLDEWCGTISTFADFLQNHYTVHLYVTVLKNPDTIRRLISEKCTHLIVIRAVDQVPNRGMDIGGFLWQLKTYRDELQTHVAVWKLHTKSNKAWKNNMIEPFLQPNAVEYIDSVRECAVGLVGARKHRSNLEYTEQHLTRCMECAVFKRMSKKHERVFVAGSIFLMSAVILHRLITEPRLQKWIHHCFTHCPIGWCVHNVPHAFERFFAYYTTMSGFECRFV